MLDTAIHVTRAKYHSESSDQEQETHAIPSFTELIGKPVEEVISECNNIDKDNATKLLVKKLLVKSIEEFKTLEAQLDIPAMGKLTPFQSKLLQRLWTNLKNTSKEKSADETIKICMHLWSTPSEETSKGMPKWDKKQD